MQQLHDTASLKVVRFMKALMLHIGQINWNNVVKNFLTSLLHVNNLSLTYLNNRINKNKYNLT